MKHRIFLNGSIFAPKIGLWHPISCQTDHDYVCKWKNDQVPTNPPPEDCPDGWEDIGTDFCYMFFEDAYVSLIKGLTEELNFENFITWLLDF